MFSDPTLRAEPEEGMDGGRSGEWGTATHCAEEQAGEIAPVADNFGSGQAG